MRFLGSLGIVVGFLASRGAADCVYDVTASPIAPFNSVQDVFPNWVMLPTSYFIITECDDVTCSWCTAGPLTGLTILNYGTASGGPAGDIRNVYFRITCPNKTDSGIVTMAYAGDWTVPSGIHPAWTWAGSVGWGADPCAAPGATGGCSCFANLYLYTDIAPCPTEGAVVELGPGYNDVLNPAWPGGLTDSCGCAAPWGETTDGNPKTIRYLSLIHI